MTKFRLFIQEKIVKKIDRPKLYEIIFESDTKAGKQFDVYLLWTILASILVVILDSVHLLHENFKLGFYLLEWLFTAIFTAEYVMRIYISPKPEKYIFSFWGIIDLLSILPTYLSLVLYGSQYLLVVRIFRLLRVFRILKLTRFNKESITLMQAMKASMYKIVLFMSIVLILVVILGTLMYVLEGEENGFTSIPQGIYWAIVTVTTVGFGDVVPQTIFGKILSSIAMLIGYAIIAVPTGIVTSEMTKRTNIKNCCPHCGTENSNEANYCNYCGESLND
ncbi:MAG: ion transporter [Bacteroidales bacterium]|nr:ion transporter [Bacteroidales bacterium]